MNGNCGRPRFVIDGWCQPFLRLFLLLHRVSFYAAQLPSRCYFQVSFHISPHGSLFLIQRLISIRPFNQLKVCAYKSIYVFSISVFLQVHAFLIDWVESVLSELRNKNRNKVVIKHGVNVEGGGGGRNPLSFKSLSILMQLWWHI